MWAPCWAHSEDLVFMNVVGLESFAVENRQSLRRSSRPPKATEKVIGRDIKINKSINQSINGIKHIFQEKKST